MRPFRPNDADDQSGRWGELLLDVEVVGLNVRILEVWIDGCRSEAARASDRGGVRERDRLSCRGCGREGRTERRIAVQARDDAGDGFVSQEGISETNNRFLVFEGTPHDARPGLEILVVRLERLVDSVRAHLCQGNGGGVENGEAISGFRGGRIPSIAKAKLQGEVGHPFEAVFGKAIVGRRKNAVGGRSRKAEACYRVARESKDGGIEREVIVVNAADFATQGKVMAPLQPAQRVVRDAARVATPLGKDGRAAEVESASLNVNLREPNRSVDSAVDAKIGGIQPLVWVENNVDPVVADA